MVALTSGLVYFTQVAVHGTYLSDLLPGFLLVGVGLGFSFVPISIAALAGVRPAEAGLASGLFNTTQQIGGALGIAVLSTIATSRTSHALAHGTALPSALVHGFTGAFVVGAGIAAVGIVAALTLIRRDELEQAPELEPALDLGRVGIYGHSFGGFMSALAVERRPDVFRVGVASAPVVDWMNYDTAYTERYLGVPPPAGTADDYPRNGLLAYAKDLSRPLLVIHGTADDNVHFSESLLLADTLFRAGKKFDFLPLAGMTHIIADPALQARDWQRVFAFFDQHLRREP